MCHLCIHLFICASIHSFDSELLETNIWFIIRTYSSVLDFMNSHRFDSLFEQITCDVSKEWRICTGDPKNHITGCNFAQGVQLRDLVQNLMSVLAIEIYPYKLSFMAFLLQILMTFLLPDGERYSLSLIL